MYVSQRKVQIVISLKCKDLAHKKRRKDEEEDTQMKWEGTKHRKKDILTSFKRPKWPTDQTRDYILSVVSPLRTTNQNKINITQ